MEEERFFLTLFDLIQRARPLTGTSALVPSRRIITLVPRKSPVKNQRGKSSSHACQNSNLQTLKPLNNPMLLIGTLTLPSFTMRTSPIQCTCFQFSDGSATVCCAILDFDPKMIDQKIRILAWNFIPLKYGDGGVKGGLLEVISWDYFQACSGDVCSFSGFGSFCLSIGACDVKDNSRASCLILGVIESISPIFVVPCASGNSGSRDISGVLANVVVCQCKSCASKLLLSELKGLSEKNVKDHSFIKTVIVYFCGLTSSWHPVISRLVGQIVLLTGLKKKLVYISKEESQLMYVTTDEVSLHIANAKLFKERGSDCNNDIRGEGECGSYTGIITGFYMQGMVVELDQNVILLLTDQYLTVPHCARVGAIVTLKNVHFVDPKFRWGKMLILGACCRTSMHVESFSPLETWCHSKSHSQCHLQKFIDSLPFAARLWALLVVSCFRKKFAGILSKKEIFGSKHKEGLAEKYASSHLPLSASLLRHGLLPEFCKHDLCSVGKEAHYGYLRLVLPITNLISYCEASWKKFLGDQENFSDFACGINQNKPLSCGGRSYVQSVRRVLCSEEVGVLVLGTLKISLSSGKLQLVDATGGIDIMTHLPTNWDFDGIFEAKNFRLIMEGIPPKLVDLDSTICQPLSCRSIFSNALPLRRTKTSIYLYHCSADKDFRSHSLFFDRKKNSQELENGKYHLLMLTHKFPIQQKFQGDLAKRSNVFAQAIILPWDLLVAGRYEDTVPNTVSSGHWKDSLENFTRPEKHHNHKRCKVERSSVEASSYSLNDADNGLSGQLTDFCSTYSSSHTENTCVLNYPLELPCLIASKGINFHYCGMLHCINKHVKMVSCCKSPKRKVLLEFCPDSLCMYEVLKIGCCYLVKYQEEDMVCPIKENYQVSCAKISISSGTHVRNVRFSSIETLQSSDVSDGFPFCNLHSSSDEIISKGHHQQFEISCLTGNGIGNDIYSDINVFVPYTAQILLEKAIKVMDDSPLEPIDSFKEESDTHEHGESMINASMQSSGTSCSVHPLPEGNLITLSGCVLGFHDCNGEAFPAQTRSTPGEGCLPMFTRGNGGVCVHVLVDTKTVRIFCDLNKQTYPIGLGTNVYATFHRILVLSVQSKYMMTPVSFITIKDTSLTNGHLNDEFNYPSGTGTVGLSSATSPNTVPTALLSDALQLSEPKPIKFCSRVVAVYILVVEKARTTAVSQSSVHSIQSAFGIPFAGFVMGDGSSSCCCWTDSENAAALLGLESEDNLLEYCAEAFGRAKAGKGSTVGHLNHILEQHDRVVVKNYGYIFDSSCQDLAFSVDSDRLLSSSDEDLLRSLITDAFLSPSWTIVGSRMDTKATKWLEKRLTEVDVVILPLVNIWVTSVCHKDMLAEARSIVQDLI